MSCSTQVFDLLGRLGSGNFGYVYKARDRRDGQIVAIKIVQVDAHGVADLQQEIRLLSRSHSPYIVAYKGAFGTEQQIWVCNYDVAVVCC